MEIICDSCKAKLNIPDEKLPKGQRVAISCPKCKNKISVDMQKLSSDESPSDIESDERSPDTGSGNLDLDFIQAGEKPALVIENDPGQKEIIKNAVQAMGYKYFAVDSTTEGISKLRFQSYNLVILSDHVDDLEHDHSHFLHYMNHLPMSSRRNIFLALIGGSFKSMDKMKAYTLSANLVINRNDMNTLESILKNAIMDHEKFYKVFMDTLLETGKI